MVYRNYELPWFRSISWYFLFCANYFFYGETINEYFGSVLQEIVYFFNLDIGHFGSFTFFDLINVVPFLYLMTSLELGQNNLAVNSHFEININMQAGHF